MMAVKYNIKGLSYMNTSFSSVVLRCAPAVCAVGNEYNIIVPVKCCSMVNLEVGGKVYFDEDNGIIRTLSRVHRFRVPMDCLDAAGCYTVHYKKIAVRQAYCTMGTRMQQKRFTFRGLKKTENINICHVADTHGIISEAIEAGNYFGNELDLLILNGDITSSTSCEKDIMTTFDIASGITGGEIPCVITRGNHDLRGALAEKLSEYMPCYNGRQYYTVKLGALWLMVLDCGEDKEDSHCEYGGMVCCHLFRERETEFIKKTIAENRSEYESSPFRLIISHIPFSYNNDESSRGEKPFDIEKPLYTEWCSLLRENIKPQLFLAGHMHKTVICPPGGKYDCKNIGCYTLIGSRPTLLDGKGKGFTAELLTLSEHSAEVIFRDNRGNKTNKEKLSV